MNPITVLLVTLWLTYPPATGDHIATARVLVAPSPEACQADSPAILASIKKSGIPVGAITMQVDKISGICLTFEPPMLAAK